MAVHVDQAPVVAERVSTTRNAEGDSGHGSDGAGEHLDVIEPPARPSARAAVFPGRVTRPADRYPLEPDSARSSA